MKKMINRKSPNYWKDWDNVEAELKKVIDELGHFPSYNELRKFDSMTSPIDKYHGGLENVKNKMGYGMINTREQFMDFLKGDETARNLAVASIGLNGEGYDVEQILIEIYNGKFKDQDQLHRLLEEAENEIYELVDEGVTNLGSYLGGFSLGDRRIFPLLLGEALANIPEERISQPLEERLTRILRVTYSPRFNDNPTGILEELKGKIDSSDGKIKVLYEKLYGHYEDVLELGDELKC